MRKVYQLMFSTKEIDAVNKLRAVILMSITYLMLFPDLALIIAYYLDERLRVMVNQDPRYLLFGSLFVCIIANLLARYGRVEQSGLFLSIGMIPVIVFDDTAHLVSTTTGIAFLLPIMIVGVSNGPRAILMVTFICEFIIVIIASIHGWTETTFDIIFIPSLVALIFALVVKTMQTALKEMRGKIRLELELQEERIKSLQAEEKSHFIASIAHDIRGPIKAADELLQMYQEEDMDSNERNEIISTVQNTLMDVYRTITDHMKRSSLKSSKKSMIDIVDFVKSFVDGINLKIKIDIIDKTNSRFCVKMDVKVIERVMYNIILNSKEAGATHINITMMMIGNDFVVRISDNGPGYPKKILIDGPQDGFTLKNQGLGIGLVGVVRNLAAQNIRVDFSNKIEQSGAITTIFFSS